MSWRDTLRLLIVEDNPGDARLIAEMLRESGIPAFEVAVADSLKAARLRLAEGRFDAILVDLGLPDSDGLTTFKTLRALVPRLPILVLSGLGDEQLARQAVREGAQDYLVKGRFQPDLLGRAVTYALERCAVSEQLAEYRDHLERLVGERTAQLRGANDRLRKAERLASLGTLAAGLGHDLGNLILPLRCRLDAVEAAVPPSIGHEVQAMRSSLDYLGRLSSSLLTLASIPDAANRQHTDLAAWWARCSSMLRTAVPPTVAIAAQFDPDLPLAAIAEDQVTRVVLNLFVNAADAGGSDVAITLSARPHAPDPAFVAIEVRDNGPGMPEHVLRHVMEPFFTTKRRALSTGLGLALVHAVTQAVGGSVEIDSAPGRGAAIRLLIPVAPPPEPRRAPPPPDSAPGAVIGVADERVAGCIEAILRAHGHHVRRAPPGAPEPCRIWFTDPLPSALPACLELRQHRPHHIVVLGRASAAWAAVDARVIDDPSDVRAIASAIQSCEQPRTRPTA